MRCSKKVWINWVQVFTFEYFCVTPETQQQSLVWDQNLLLVKQDALIYFPRILFCTTWTAGSNWSQKFWFWSINFISEAAAAVVLFYMFNQVLHFFRSPQWVPWTRPMQVLLMAQLRGDMTLLLLRRSQDSDVWTLSWVLIHTHSIRNLYNSTVRTSICTYKVCFQERFQKCTVLGGGHWKSWGGTLKLKVIVQL